MVVSVHQPSYFPWLGLLDKIARSELYILMDEVQLADRAFQHRNLFADMCGRVRYLSIPINKKGFRGKKIRDITIFEADWQQEHRNFILSNYRRAPFFDQIFGLISPLYERDYTFLIDPLLDSMRLSMDFFDIKTPLKRQSELVYDRESRKSDLILELVKAVGGTVYLSGTGSKDYLIIEDFEKQDIKVVFNDFLHPRYGQAHSGEFITGLSCLDVLFNVGIERSRKLIGRP